MRTAQNNKGLTLIGMVLVVVIMLILAAVAMTSLSKFRNEQDIKNTVEDVVTLLNTARNNTLSSLNATNYGVHFENTRAVLFTGNTFVNSDPNNVVSTLPTSVEIPVSGGINLSGGGSDIVFTRLTGDTSNYGTIVIRLTSTTSRTTTVTISKTGIVSTN
jgi:type II secretory pathway pseudopilin PulG